METDAKPESRAELLAPAGDFDTALAAFDAGADAVYCGLGDFSARAFAHNFSSEDLGNLMRVARASSRKVYVTFNTLIEEAELERAAEKLSLLEAIGVDGIIVQDLGVAQLYRKYFPSLTLHASTQLVAHNLEGVLALKELGFKRVVLARELTLDEVRLIAQRSGVEIECFIHGALCYSLSGLCLYSAMEKGRSGNRGRCAYCCRLPLDGAYPFSMKDLRLGEDARLLAQAGVASLKIEGRMKSALYVASVVKYYRELLDGAPQTITAADLETVFSRKTTPLYLHGERDNVIEPEALGHMGTPIGQVKRVTKDRQGRRWIRLHTSRALERHDGLQILSPDGGKPLGFGITEMRKALSRSTVFEVAAGDDVEIFVPDTVPDGAIAGGETVFHSMSNAVKRQFPPVTYRASDYRGIKPLNMDLSLARDKICAMTNGTAVERAIALEPARDAASCQTSAERAFSRLGGTDWHLESLKLVNPDGLFAPASILNDMRRELVEKLDEADARERERRLAAIPFPASTAATANDATTAAQKPPAYRFLRTASLSNIPEGDWAEIIVDIPLERIERAAEAARELQTPVRFAISSFTRERDYPRLRTAVKKLMHLGFTRFEAADLAALRMLAALGVSDISADWSLYAANSYALELLTSLGAKRFVASPEASAENIASLAALPFDIEFLERQSTPLFISLHKPQYNCNCASLVSFQRGSLWITTRERPRTFAPPKGVSTRLDLSWDKGENL